jgi:hypothetical protein
MRRLCGFAVVFFCLVATAQDFTGTLGKSSLPMSGKWAFHTGDDLAWAQPGLDDSKWERITADDPWGGAGASGVCVVSAGGGD